MNGLFFKDIKVCKHEVIVVFIFQAIISFIILFFTMHSRDSLSEEVVKTLVLSKVFMYLLDLLFVSMVNIGVMSKDEKKNWHIFINSVPNGKKAQIRSKYTFIFFLYLLTISWLFILDTITVAICNNTQISLGGNLVVLLSIIIIYDSFPIPFILGFGATNGDKIKTTFFSGVLFLGILYFLFGDVSMFMDGNFEEKIMRYLGTSKGIYIMAFLPYVAALIYWLSYRITLLLYKKEGSRYEE